MHANNFSCKTLLYIFFNILPYDSVFFLCVCVYFQNIVSKTNAVMRELDSLEKETTTASITVENCIQNLNIMSSKQYMEKRVYDEEVVEKKEEIPNPAELSPDSFDIAPKVREALSYGLPVVKACGDDISHGNLVGNCYLNRSLPFMLESETFIETPSAGTVPTANVSFSSDVLPPPEIPSAGTVAITSKKILLPSEQSPEVSSEYSSEVSPESSPKVSPKFPHGSTPEFHTIPRQESFTSVNNVVGNLPPSSECEENKKELPESSAPNVIPTQSSVVSSLHAELAARFKGASTGEKSSITSKENPEFVPELEDSKLPIIQPPKKNLFDQTSDEDEDDLFKVNPTKSTLPSNFKSIPPLDSKTPFRILPAINTDPKKASNAKSLFETSDSEEDIFASKTLKKGNVKENKAQSLFNDEDDDDDDLLDWMPSRTNANKENSTSVNNDPVNKLPPAVNKNRTSLFEDNDSDDDLFSTGPPTPIPSRPFASERPVRKLLKVLPDLRIGTEISNDPSEVRMSFDYDSPPESSGSETLPNTSGYLKTSPTKPAGSMSPFRATPSPLADDNNLLKKVATTEVDLFRRDFFKISTDSSLEPESPPIDEPIPTKDIFKQPIDSKPEVESLPTEKIIGPEDLLKKGNETQEPESAPDTESTPRSLIASLKLSLSKQPNAPNFSTPSLISPDVKPFGGVPLFSPISPITPATTSSISSDPVEETEDSESLHCVAKNRPRAPNKRRPQSRSHRRSMILEEEALPVVVRNQLYEIINCDKSVIFFSLFQFSSETSDVATDSQISPLDVAVLDFNDDSKKDSEEIVKDKKSSLFSDGSDSSDGELFSKLKKTNVKVAQNNRLIPTTNVQKNRSLFEDSDDGNPRFSNS